MTEKSKICGQCKANNKILSIIRKNTASKLIFESQTCITLPKRASEVQNIYECNQNFNSKRCGIDKYKNRIKTLQRKRIIA